MIWLPAKIDNSYLQAGALLAVGVVAGIATVERQWDIVGMAVTGFFAILNIHPKESAAPPDANPPPQP